MTLRRALIVLVMLAILAGLIWYGFFEGTRGSSADTHGGHTKPVPVLVAKASTRDVPIVLSGVGTIQASNTVTVQPQVNGKLLSVNFTEGQHVDKGDLLAKIDPVTYRSDLAEARAKLSLDQAALDNARQNLDRYEKLVKNNYVSQQQADEARATVRQNRAQVESDQAAVESAKAQLGYTTVTAPISGRTGLRLVDAGNIVSANSTDLVVITKVKPIAVVFTLPAEDIDPIAAAGGNDANSKLAVRVTGSDSDKVLDTGHLAVVNNQVNTDTGTIKLKAIMPNKHGLLWPGQFVNVQLQIGTRQNATVVPIAAVQQGPEGAFVYTIGPHNKAAMTPVDVVQQNEHIAVIGHGIKPGTTVITAGFGQLSDGSPIKRPSNGKPANKTVSGAAATSGGDDPTTPAGQSTGQSAAKKTASD